MFLIAALFAAATRPTIAAAFPVHLVADLWTSSSAVGGGGGGTIKIEEIETLNNFYYARADTTNPENLRSISDIIWSCLATVFACSWVSVHPNIPAPDDSDFSVLLRRIGLVFWAIFAPELLIVWAMRQWLHANKIARKYRSRGWTTVHGHFLIMGGFMLHDHDGKLSQTLSIENFDGLLKAKSIDFPLISKKEILDRSKGDLLSKSIVMIQVAWFAVQCMARRSQGLAITELELVTLAFTTLNGALYFFWWDKPLDVQSTVRIALKKPVAIGAAEKKPAVKGEAKPEGIDIVENSQTEVDEGPSENTISNATAEHKYQPLEVEDAPLMDSDDEQDKLPRKTRLWNHIIETPRSIGHAILELLEAIWLHVKEQGIVGSIFEVFIELPCKHILNGFGNIVESKTSQNVAQGALRVPMFYAPPISFDASDLTRIVASGLGVVFGSIHLAAWSGEFPTRGAQTTWRVTSLIVTLLPAVIFVAKMLWRFFERLGGKWEDLCVGPMMAIEVLMGAGGIFVYVMSRFALFIIAFYCLKSIPPSGFQKVAWTSFIPHIS